VTTEASAQPSPAQPASALVSREALFAIAVALVLWTTNVIFVREADGDILGFTTWRMIFAVPVLIPIALYTRRSANGAARTAKVATTPGVRLAMVLVGMLFGFSALLNFVSINETTLVNVGVIHSLQPAVVALFAGRYMGEHVDWRLMARSSVAILGAFLVAAASSGQGTWSLHGDVLAVIGLLLNSVWFLAGRWIRSRTEIDATDYMLVVFTTSAVLLSTIAFLDGDRLAASSAVIGWAAITALLGTVGHTLVAWAHKWVPASVSSLFLLSQPVMIAVLAWIVFDEALVPLQILGGAIVLGALAGIVTRAGEPAPVAAELPDARDD
jgi:drug/metabolite transporter (DMT)-like permease